VVGALLLLVAVPVHATGEEHLVLGLSLSGVHKAYPTEVFTLNPVLNDEIRNQQVVVYYDSRNNAAAAYFRLVAGEPLEFSGRASGNVADDLTTATRWDLASGQAVGGNLAGAKLVPIPVRLTSFDEWMAKHPKGVVHHP
jgi:hypothetical protein